MAVSFASAPPPEDENEVPWTTFGGLALYEEIGRGGMGAVYRARQVALRRDVAVKVLLRAQFASASERARFHRESQAAARLHHPGIVGVLDVGEDEGMPWFSMELIRGNGLDKMVQDYPMSASSAAECVRKVAKAIQHAHEQGVLHRDLKPSNILIDNEGEPRVTDFGIARIAASATPSNRNAELTRTGQSLGSPGYAAPEQVLHGQADVRTDVYGLGALLYHLLTGRPPFQGPTLDAIIVQLRENDPLSPHLLNPSVPRDLETICLKCLRKQPENRYTTSAAVAEDLSRFIEGKPILARPLGILGKTWRLARRHPGMAALIFVSAALLAALVSGSLLMARKQQQMEHRSALLSEARSLRMSRAAGTRGKALESLRAAWTIAPSREIRDEAIACLALPDITGKRTVPASAFQQRDLTLSADGKRSAVIEKGTLIVRDAATQKEIARLPGHARHSLLKLDDFGRRVAVAPPKSKDLTLYNLEDGQVIVTCDHKDVISSMDWRGELIATGCANRFIHIWDTKGRNRHRLNGHEGGAWLHVSFRPRSQELVSVSADSHILLWHAARGEQIAHFNLPHPDYTALWWSEGGEEAFARRTDGSADVYTIPRSPVFDLLAPPSEEPHSENLGTAALDATGTIAAVCDEGCARVWDFTTGCLVEEFKGSPTMWRSVQLSAGPPPRFWICGWEKQLTGRVLTRAENGRLIIGPPGQTMLDHGNLIRQITSDGKLAILSNNHDGQFIAFWPETQKTVRMNHPGNLATVLSHDQQWLLTTSYQSNGAKIWSLPEGNLQRTIAPEDQIIQAALSADGNRVLLDTGHRGRLFLTRDWTEVKLPAGDLQLESMAFSPDGRYLATLGDDHILLRHADDFTEVMRLTLPPHIGWVGQGHLVFNADGAKLILHTALGSVARWELRALDVELSEFGTPAQ